MKNLEITDKIQDCKFDNNNLYKMALGDVLMVEDGNLYTTALRVPGGWIFRSYDKSVHILSAVFVPYNNEFQEPEDEKK